MAGNTEKENKEQNNPYQQDDQKQQIQAQDQSHVQKIIFKVHQTDITEDMLLRISKIINLAFDTRFSSGSLKLVTEQIKKFCDLEFGRFWHCIIGKTFSSNVSHGMYIDCIKIKKQIILIFFRTWIIFIRIFG